MLLKPIVEYETYKASLEKLNKAKLYFENMQKLCESAEKISNDLSSTLGIEKIGEQINFDQIDKVERKSKTRNREMQIAEKEYFKAEQQLKETIVEIKKLRRADARKIGQKLIQKVLRILDEVEKLGSDYALLYKDIGADLSKQDKIDFGGEESIIGGNLRYINFSSKKATPTHYYLEKLKGFDERAKMYEENRKIAEDEIKDI